MGILKVIMPLKRSMASLSGMIFFKRAMSAGYTGTVIAKLKDLALFERK